MTAISKPRGASRTPKVMITAGPTEEYIDPVRYITNRSTGTMGYSIARECLKKGFSVSLITGPVCLKPPAGAKVVKVVSAKEMLKEVMARRKAHDCLIMAAAVCDFRPRFVAKKKIKKQKTLKMTFVKNTDILGDLRGHKGIVKIGFALETDNPVLNGRKKLKSKELDLIIVNAIRKSRSPFGDSETDYTLISKNGVARHLKKMSKPGIARVIAAEARRMTERQQYDK